MADFIVRTRRREPEEEEEGLHEDWETPSTDYITITTSTYGPSVPIPMPAESISESSSPLYVPSTTTWSKKHPWEYAHFQSGKSWSYPPQWLSNHQPPSTFETSTSSSSHTYAPDLITTTRKTPTIIPSVTAQSTTTGYDGDGGNDKPGHQQEHKGLGHPAKAGLGAVAGAVVVGIILLLGMCWWKRKRVHPRNQHVEVSDSPSRRAMESKQQAFMAATPPACSQSSLLRVNVQPPPPPVILAPMVGGYQTGIESSEVGSDVGSMLSANDRAGIANPFGDSMETVPPPAYTCNGSSPPSYRGPTPNRSAPPSYGGLTPRSTAPGSLHTASRSSSMRTVSEYQSHSSIPTQSSQTEYRVSPFDDPALVISPIQSENMRSPFDDPDDSVSVITGHTRRYNQDWDAVSALSDASSTDGLVGRPRT